jgi:polysaccharide pyruvyl transferase WcaK-like protein
VGLGLLSLARYLKSRGSRVALVNTVWQSNSSIACDMIRNFDLVTVRDSGSLRAIQSVRPDAYLVPDLAFSAFQEALDDLTLPEHLHQISVVDSAHDDRSFALYNYADSVEAPYFVMVDRPRLYRQHLNSIGHKDRNLPSVIMLSDLLKARFWVTGRLQAAIACVCLGIPFAAVHSESHKIAYTLRDAGVGFAVLPLDWTSLPLSRQQDAVNRIAAQWNEGHAQGVKAFLRKSADAHKAMFTALGMLARETT